MEGTNMTIISINIDEQTKYSIELKDQYNPKDFIKTFEGHISKVKNLLSMPSSGERPTNEGADSRQKSLFESNDLFEKLNQMIESLGNDIYKEDHTTMRSFKFNRPYRRKGFAWLAPKGQSLVVYLRKGDHSSVDKKKKIIQKKTFGGFPMLYIRTPDEVDYAFNIIKKIYQSP